MPRATAIVSAMVLALIVRIATAADVAIPGTDPSRAGWCAAYDGLAFTFCVAYCEARECDRAPVGDERCAIIRRGFGRVTDGDAPPCGAELGARAHQL
jgi:hypothetical protein